MRRTATVTGLMLLALPVLATDGAAQDRHPSLTLEVYGGGADYGRFLEQSQLSDFAIEDGVLLSTQRQRELTAETAFSLGGSVGIWPWRKTGARLAFTWSPTELAFEDDSGIGSEAFDTDELVDLNTYAASLELLRFLLDGVDRTFAPYATAGIAVSWWNIDEELLLDGDDTAFGIVDGTEFRWGGLGGLGLQIRLARSWTTRLEVTTFGLGNPFDGDEGFRTTSPAWFTFDEPSTVRMTRFTLGVTYDIARDGVLLSR